MPMVYRGRGVPHRDRSWGSIVAGAALAFAIGLVGSRLWTRSWSDCLAQALALAVGIAAVNVARKLMRHH